MLWLSSLSAPKKKRRSPTGPPRLESICILIVASRHMETKYPAAFSWKKPETDCIWPKIDLTVTFQTDGKKGGRYVVQGLPVFFLPNGLVSKCRDATIQVSASQISVFFLFFSLGSERGPFSCRNPSPHSVDRAILLHGIHDTKRSFEEGRKVL